MVFTLMNTMTTDINDIPRMYKVLANVPRYAWSADRFAAVIALTITGYNTKPINNTTTADNIPYNSLSI